MNELHTLTATEIVAAIRSGRTTAVAVAEDCLARIAAVEPDVEAWTFLDPDLVLRQARAVDGRADAGPLQGVPVGLKDIIDTADMPTEYGTPIHQGRRPSHDAACTALTRRAGGVVMGKTVTTEFANRFPGKARNPHDPTRTPGGSSSGSGAAVGASMVPLALGTQTTASTIRPASFCGCVGYVPSRGDIRLVGVMEAAGSFDALGLMARSVEDIHLYRSVLVGVPEVAMERLALAGLRVGVARTAFWDECEPETRRAVEDCAAALGRAGARVSDVDLPAGFDAIPEAHRWVSSFEFVRNRAWEIDHHWDRISEPLRGARIADGMGCSFARYDASRATLRDCALQLDDLQRDVDVLLTPAAAGEAPVGLQSTGNASFSTLWTALNVPAVTLPMARGAHGMPIGLQWIGSRWADDRLLATARAVAHAIGLAA
jgi:amidase